MDGKVKERNSILKKKRRLLVDAVIYWSDPLTHKTRRDVRELPHGIL